MTEYEVIIEAMNPCGGSQYATRTFQEIETDDPQAYVRENSPYPLLETDRNPSGDLVITTGNEKGYRMIFTFTE